METGATKVGGPERRGSEPDRRVAATARRRLGTIAPQVLRAAADGARQAIWRVRRSATAKALHELDRQEERQSVYRRVFADAPVGIALVDRRLRVIDANGELLSMTGRTAAGLRDLPIDELGSRPHPARLALMARKAALGGDPVVVNHRYQRADGSEGWARTTIRRLGGGDPEVDLICVVQDLTLDQMALEEQRREAERDPLTGLLNRRGGDRRLRAALERMAEIGPVAVIVCDADRFKEVNDRFGHAAGDELLAGMAGRLRSAVRASDEVARMGGDEFIVVARVADEDEAAAIAERCVRVASGPFRLAEAQGHPEQVTLSAGVAVAFPGGPVEPGSLVAAADRALYAAKAEGGGRSKMAHPG